MNLLASALLVSFILLTSVQASASEALSLNMSLENETPVEPCVLSGQCAIGHVYVNVTEPPAPPGITGMLTAFDYGQFLEEARSFFSSLFSWLL
ncbi:MAG: hypothetical protein J7K54_02945 [Candidatus Aenigmarchaeota archaeon]|nr:hypothetical protein [Candidatus Aenigmarchaeota archaeon]